jgi:hypothetical protein
MTFMKVEPHGQEPVAPAVRRNPPKLQSSFAKASEDTRIPPRPGGHGFLRRRVKALLGFRAKGRKITRSGEGYQVREASTHYNVFLGAENEDIGPENTYSWNLNL